jgi:hypothetical protein
MELYVSNLIGIIKKTKHIKGVDLNKLIFSKIGMSEDSLNDIRDDIQSKITASIERRETKAESIIKEQNAKDKGVK